MTLRRGLPEALTSARHLIDLPADVLEALDAREAIATAGHELANVSVIRPDLVAWQRLARGDDPIDIAAEELEAERMDAIITRAEKVVSDAGTMVGLHMLRQRVGDGEQIITGPLRAKVAGLVEAARAHARALAQYAPGYDPAEILAGPPAAIKAYNAASALQDDYDVLLDLWRAFVTPANGATLQVIRSVAAPAAEAAWERPELVAEDVRGRHLRSERTEDNRAPGTASLLAIAAQPTEAGYRLLSNAELVALFERHEAQLVDEERRTLHAKRTGQMAAFA